jgi:nucleoside-diphosphate-sugar epimerase
VLECDLLAPSSVARLPDLVAGCTAVAHIATAIPRDPRVPGAWDVTTRLRTEGTHRLLDAALTAGVHRYIQQSIVMAYPDGGDRVLDEATPLDTAPERASVCGPVIAMEGMIRDVPPARLAWCILRGGEFVGPGTFQDGIIAALHAGTAVVPCDGRNFVSLVHVADMAAAILAAVRRAPGGSTFNITAEPLRQGAYLDGLAARSGAPPPPRDLARPCPLSFRCSNAAARTALNWTPEHGIWPS